MLVGEQPGDEEDKKGLPFVGRPDACSTAPCGGRRRSEDLYVTNTVKHFKCSSRQAAAAQDAAQREVDACRQWARARDRRGEAPLLVTLGATAARAVISKDFKVSTMRGQFVESPLAPYVFATFHPSALLG